MTPEETSVLRYAQGHMRQRVGDGECWDLAESALRSANAVTSNDIHGAALDQVVDYQWGDEIPLSAVGPGDIVQFRNGYGFTRKVTKPDGSYETYTFGPVDQHHTAVVERALNPGRAFRVLHQNVPPRTRRVTTMDCYFVTYSSLDSAGNTVEVTVSGDAVFYKPRPKLGARARR
jgi:hypothetical protein